MSKTIIRTFVILLITSCVCLAGETAGSENKDKTTDQEPQDVNSTVLVSLGDRELTIGQAKWGLPSYEPSRLVWFAKMWLEVELFYEDAQRQGLTEQEKNKFLADLEMKKTYSVPLARDIVKVEISDEEVKDYYEKNKFENTTIKTPAQFSFSHIQVKTLREAENAIKFIKGGEDFNEMAKKVSIAEDAQKGGKYRGVTKAVEQKFGREFLEALEKAKTGQVIGPIQVEGGFEIARLERHTKSTIRSFDRVKSTLKSKLSRERGQAQYDEYINKLKEKSKYTIEKSEVLLEMEKEVESQTKAGPSITKRN
jgi:parvulin-like peptidyl-prolyl isomerase